MSRTTSITVHVPLNIQRRGGRKVVIAPDGSVYHGNQMDQGESVAGAPGFDRINNVECIILNAPLPGEYTIRVREAR